MDIKEKLRRWSTAPPRGRTDVIGTLARALHQLCCCCDQLTGRVDELEGGGADTDTDTRYGPVQVSGGMVTIPCSTIDVTTGVETPGDALEFPGQKPTLEKARCVLDEITCFRVYGEIQYSATSETTSILVTWPNGFLSTFDPPANTLTSDVDIAAMEAHFESTNPAGTTAEATITNEGGVFTIEIILCGDLQNWSAADFQLSNDVSDATSETGFGPGSEVTLPRGEAIEVCSYCQADGRFLIFDGVPADPSDESAALQVFTDRAGWISGTEECSDATARQGYDTSDYDPDAAATPGNYPDLADEATMSLALDVAIPGAIPGECYRHCEHSYEKQEPGVSPSWKLVLRPKTRWVYGFSQILTSGDSTLSDIPDAGGGGFSTFPAPNPLTPINSLNGSNGTCDDMLLFVNCGQVHAAVVHNTPQSEIVFGASCERLVDGAPPAIRSPLIHSYGHQSWRGSDEDLHDSPSVPFLDAVAVPRGSNFSVRSQSWVRRVDGTVTVENPTNVISFVGTNSTAS